MVRCWCTMVYGALLVHHGVWCAAGAPLCMVRCWCTMVYGALLVHHGVWCAAGAPWCMVRCWCTMVYGALLVHHCVWCTRHQPVPPRWTAPRCAMVRHMTVMGSCDTEASFYSPPGLLGPKQI